MEKEPKMITIVLSYIDATTLASIINMYCNGPQYHNVIKSLSSSSKVCANQISKKIFRLKEKTRNTFPDLFISRPYTMEALSKIHELRLTTDEISILLTIFSETMKESEKDKFYELELLAAPIDDVKRVYEILLNAYRAVQNH